MKSEQLRIISDMVRVHTMRIYALFQQIEHATLWYELPLEMEIYQSRIKAHREHRVQQHI